MCIWRHFLSKCVFVCKRQAFFFLQALQKQRAVVERMKLTPPAHIEIVDCYVHKGEVESVDYFEPWTQGERKDGTFYPPLTSQTKSMP